MILRTQLFVGLYTCALKLHKISIAKSVPTFKFSAIFDESMLYYWLRYGWRSILVDGNAPKGRVISNVSCLGRSLPAILGTHAL